ncbi:hypothetical protein [Vibrio splendidus]|uniref:hypothetical protein n=2 Tax=Vibrio splendidus TaxID=29497 RepID=UPI0011B22B91|nr:hypothetical protein [Vibrio splendidus]
MSQYADFVRKQSVMQHDKGYSMSNRDDFTKSTRRALAERVGYRCSNPECGVETAGAKIGCINKAAKIGVAAHITAAAPEGARYDPSLTTSQRKNISNGIWLCHSCSVLIDNDDFNYSVERINGWKSQAELGANARIGKRSNNANDALLHQAESVRIKQFIDFIYGLFHEFELGLGSLSVDVYYVDKLVFEKIMNIDDHYQTYQQEYRSYDLHIQNVQNDIMDIIYSYRNFLIENNYYELAHSFKLLEDCQYYYSQELENKVEYMGAKLKRLASLVFELHQFRERR